MQELRLIFGWIMQVIGILLIIIAIWSFLIFAGCESIITGDISYNIENSYVRESLVEFGSGILLTWIGLRLRRDL